MSVRKLLPDQPPLIGLPPLLSPSPAPSPSVSFEGSTRHSHFFFFPSITVADSIFDLAAVPIIGCILLLSLLSLSIVIYLRLRSRFLQHLQHFTTLWTVRSLLVFFASFWLLNETLRLSFLRQNYFYPFFPTLTADQQADLCNLHVVLSLGFFEPGFLVTLLFLVNVSIRKRFPSRMWALASVSLVCSPIFTLQILFVFFTPLKARLPAFMHVSFVSFTDSLGKQTVLCKYPLLSTGIFGAFTIGYLLVFLISCYKLVAFVINKNLQSRINMLASTVMVTLPLQILCLAVTQFWSPGSMMFGGFLLAAFICVACMLIVGQMVLVIKPITEALAAAGGGGAVGDSSSRGGRRAEEAH